MHDLLQVPVHGRRPHRLRPWQQGPNAKIIAENRAYTVEELGKLGFTTLPSQANFIFTSCPKLSGGDLYRELKRRGVLVRYWNKPALQNHVRITIGSREQMDVLLEKVREILKEV